MLSSCYGTLLKQSERSTVVDVNLVSLCLIFSLIIIGIVLIVEQSLHLNCFKNFMEDSLENFWEILEVILGLLKKLALKLPHTTTAEIPTKKKCCCDSSRYFFHISCCNSFWDLYKDSSKMFCLIYLPGNSSWKSTSYFYRNSCRICCRNDAGIQPGIYGGTGISLAIPFGNSPISYLEDSLLLKKT